MSFCEALEETTITNLFGRAHIPGNTVPHEIISEIVPKISALSQRYISRDGLLATIDEASASAYAAYYGIINGVKVGHLLSLLPQDFQPKNMLDFGAGTGTASLAASLWFKHKIALTLIEPSNGMAKAATKLLRTSYTNIDHYKTLSNLATNTPFDLIIAANAINEIPTDEQSIFAEKLLDQTSENGFLIIIEPGTQLASKGLVELRKALLTKQNNFSIVYPCFHHNECQLLSQQNGWCHSELQIQRTAYLRQVDAALGFNKHEISFSALILKKNSYSTESVSAMQNKYRIIQAPKKNKIGAQGYLCGSDYQGLVTLMKRNRNDSNRFFEKLQMHDETSWIGELTKT